MADSVCVSIFCCSINFASSEVIQQGYFAMKSNFFESERVALFIDGANLYSAARALGFDIDYRRLLKVFRAKGRLVSTLKSSPPMVADELRRQADDFIELSELALLIARNPSERAARPAVPGSNGPGDADDFSGDAPAERLVRSA